MTQGYVLAFRPATGSGAIITDDCEIIQFSGAAPDSRLTGGDTVEFPAEHQTGTPLDAAAVQILRCGTECHSEDDVAGIRQFFTTVRLKSIEPTPLTV